MYTRVSILTRLMAVCAIIFSIAGTSPSIQAAAPSRIASPVQASSQIPYAFNNTLASPDLPVATLGQSGLSYRHLQTYGTPGRPYWDDVVHLNEPTGIGTFENKVFIAEARGCRVLGFTNTMTTTAALMIGSSGNESFDGRYYFQTLDVTADQDGNIWVVSSGGPYQFDKDGKYIKKLDIPDSWPGGSGDYAGLAIDDTTGNIYVSEHDRSRVMAFDSTGTLLYTLGVLDTPGSDNQHFNRPNHIAVDDSNLLYVADSDNNRVQIFDVSNPLTATYTDTLKVGASEYDYFAYPMGVAVDATRIFVADTHHHRIQIFDRATLTYTMTLGTAGTHGDGDYQFFDPADVGIDADGFIYVADLDNFRVQQFDNDLNYIKTYGTTGKPYLTDEKHFNAPSSVAVDDNNNLYVLEALGFRLLKLDSQGNLLWVEGHAGIPYDDNTGFFHASDVAVDSKLHRVYVVDSWNGRVQIYSTEGEYLDTLGMGLHGNDQDHFLYPTGVGTDPNDLGLIYVADSGNQRVRVYDQDYQITETLNITGTPGSGKYQFNNPVDVTVDEKGYVYVADEGNQRIQMYEWQGHKLVYKSTFGGPSACGNPYDVNCVHGIPAFDQENYMYVFGDSGVHVFDDNRAYLTSIGKRCTINSADFCPSRGTVDSAGNIYNADYGFHRVQKYTPGVPGWQQSNINGFGSPHALIASLEVFSGQLYVGIGDFVNGTQIWRTTDGKIWDSVTLLGSGIGAGNTAILDMIEFDGKLYAATGLTNAPCNIWRTSNGIEWTSVITDGFGSPGNMNADAFAVFDSQLYVSVSNDAGASIYRSSTGDAGSWTPVVTEGNGDPDNVLVDDFAVFDGNLYAVGKNSTIGAFVWQSTADGNTWNQVNTSGFGSPIQMEAMSTAVFNGTLYVGTCADSVCGSGQIFKSENGTSWTLLDTTVFSDTYNDEIPTLHVFNNSLYAVVNDRTMGSEVWKTDNGTTWGLYPLNINGWGDSNNVSVLRNHATAVFNNQLYIGTFNSSTGSEIWRLDIIVSLPPAGGTVTAPADHTTYNFASGTFTETVTIFHNSVSPVALPPTDLTETGHAFSITALDSLGNTVAPNQPYTVTVQYTEEEIGRVLESTLGLYYWDADSNGWVKEPTSRVDPLNNNLTATPGHFSTWAVLADTKEMLLPLILH